MVDETARISGGMKKQTLSLFFLLCALHAMAVYRVTILSHDELHLNPEEIINLPGYGPGVVCGADSLMLLDNSDLASIRWKEPTNARSIVGCGNMFYAAECDSIYRIASHTMPRKFIGRLDNEQFTLAPSTDSTFFAITADEDFSCVYEINPETGYCTPLISIQAPLLKIFRIGDNLLLWVDDTLMIAKDADGEIISLYSDAGILDVEATPIGVFVGTDNALIWLINNNEGINLLAEGVQGLWWDDEDILYYQNIKGDIIAIVGLEDEFLKATTITENTDN